MWYELPELNGIKKDLGENDCLYLDFGHGGKDTGCIFYDGSYEKDYVLKFGLAVYKLVKPYFKKVHLTRDTNKTVELKDRTKAMKELGEKYNTVQAYSFHCNAYNKSIHGAEALLSINTNKTDHEFIFWTKFLKDYCSKFDITNRGIKQRKSSNGKQDLYYLHRNTPAAVHVQYLELFFGDNRQDCKKGQSAAYFNKAVFIVAAYILKRYGKTIHRPVEAVKYLYKVQTGAFTVEANAQKLKEDLKSKGFDTYIIRTKI